MVKFNKEVQVKHAVNNSNTVEDITPHLLGGEITNANGNVTKPLGKNKSNEFNKRFKDELKIERSDRYKKVRWGTSSIQADQGRGR